jgi:class 3 adenylate cyclase
MVSLKVKFSVITALLLGCLMAAVTWIVYNQTSAALGREVRERGATIARNLATNAAGYMLPGSVDELSLTLLIRESIQPEGGDTDLEQLPPLQQAIRDLQFDKRRLAIKNLGVVEALITDNSNSIVVHSDHSPTNTINGTQYKAPDYVSLPSDNEPYPSYLRMGHRVYDIKVPAIEKTTGKTLGTVHLGLRREIIDDAVRITATRIVAISMAGLLLSIVLTFILVRVLVKPVDYVMRGVHAIVQGDFSKRLPWQVTRDELGDLCNAYNDMAKSLGENATLKTAFSRYTSASLMEDILKDPAKMAKLGGKRVPATMFFSMVHDISEISETMDAEEFVGIINEYLSAQTEPIARNGGHIDKFVREEVMAVWGVPEPREDDAIKAVRAAVECQAALAKLNSRREKAGKPAFGVSIGVNTGEVVAGNMGSQQKMDYTVIGDAVNTSARLMANGKAGHVLITQSTYDLVKDRVVVEQLDPIRVKGKKEPLPIWNVLRVKGGSDD